MKGGGRAARIEIHSLCFLVTVAHRSPSAHGTRVRAANADALSGRTNALDGAAGAFRADQTARAGRRAARAVGRAAVGRRERV